MNKLFIPVYIFLCFTFIYFTYSQSCSFPNIILTNTTVSDTCTAINKITIGTTLSLDVIQFKMVSNANVHTNENVDCIGCGSIVLSENANLHLTQVTNLYHSSKLVMNENSVLTTKKEIYFWKYSQLTIGDSATIYFKGHFFTYENALVVMNQNTVIKINKVLFFNDKSTLTMNDNSIINSTFILCFYSATLVMNLNTQINGITFFNLYKNAHASLKDYSEINMGSNLVEVETSYLLLNDFSKINNAERIYVKRGGIINLNGTAHFSQINTKSYQSGGKGDNSYSAILNVTGNSYINVSTTFVFFNSILEVSNRDIRDLPVVFYSGLNAVSLTNFKVQSQNDFDILCSQMVKIYSSVAGTKMLLGGKLLRYGTSNKIFCHVEDVTNKIVKYSEPYCPCDDIEDWYIAPLPNVKSLFVEINKIKTSSKTLLKSIDEFSSESVLIGNTQISLYKTDSIVLNISTPKTINIKLFSLTKTVLLITETKLNFEGVQFNAALNTKDGFKILEVVIRCTNGIYIKTTQRCEDFTICNDANCKYCPFNKNSCVLCKSQFALVNSKCEHIVNCELPLSNRCLKCATGFSLKDGLCVSDETCITVQLSGRCQICTTNNGCINNNGKCVESDKNSEVITNYNIVSCNKNFVSNTTNCLKCNDLYIYSELCENGKATKCDSSSQMDTNGICKINDCVLPNDQNGKCTTTIDYCIYLSNGKCNECETEHYLSNNICNNNKKPNCILQNSFGCMKCQDTYYLDESTKQCEGCDPSCLTCFDTSTKCLSCPHNTFLSNYKCNTNEDLKLTCNKFTSYGSGCVACKDGFYRVGLDCFECDQKCKTCNNKYSCLTCNLTNYKTNSGDCLPQSDIIGCAVNVTQSGCSKCQDGYYIINTNECQECNDNCNTCTLSRNKCTSCNNSLVLLTNGSCVSLSQIFKCKEITNSKCSKCAFWYITSKDGTLCESQIVWWVIFVLVICVLIVFIILIVSIVIVTKTTFNKLHKHEINKTITLFAMNKSNINFVPLQGGVCVSSNVIDLNSDIEQIEVNRETRQVLCVGNTNKTATKIQFTISSNITKFTICIDPEVVTLKSGYACEFSVYVKPLCSCNINSTIQLV
ncbi:cysteine surface protein, putative, partial [Entamoeba invadens IP1]